ncbi:MAG: hypothetical protein AAB653_00805 [Patescibacteria group bacterium]
MDSVDIGEGWRLEWEKCYSFAFAKHTSGAIVKGFFANSSWTIWEEIQGYPVRGWLEPEFS